MTQLANLESLLAELVPKLARKCFQIAKLVVPTDAHDYHDMVIQVALAVLEDQLLLLRRRGYLVPSAPRSDSAFRLFQGEWEPHEDRIWVSASGWLQRIRDNGGSIPGEYLG